MTTEFSARFLKDLDKLPDSGIKGAVADIIEGVEAADQITDILNLKKLTGFKTA